MPIKLLLFL